MSVTEILLANTSIFGIRRAAGFVHVMTIELARLFDYPELNFVWKRRLFQVQGPVKLKRSTVRGYACDLTFFQRILNGLGLIAFFECERFPSDRVLIYQCQFVRGLQREPKLDFSTENLEAVKHHVTGAIRPKPETDTTVEVPWSRDPSACGCQNVEIRHQYHLHCRSMETSALCVFGPSCAWN